MLAGEWSSAWQRFAEGGGRKERQGHNRTEQKPHTVPVSIRRNCGYLGLQNKIRVHARHLALHMPQDASRREADRG